MDGIDPDDVSSAAERGGEGRSSEDMRRGRGTASEKKVRRPATNFFIPLFSSSYYRLSAPCHMKKDLIYYATFKAWWVSRGLRSG